MKYDFSGYATKIGLKCADGRTILKDAFKHQDGTTVPLVWQHLHNDPGNILGHAVLENRDDGVYCYGKFNESEAGKNAKELVRHGDISSLSIYANQLKQQARNVVHGAIREVSLVMSGANPGALIDDISFAHGDDAWDVEDNQAIIYTGLELTHSADQKDDDTTVADIFDTFTEEQKQLVYGLIAHAISSEEDDILAHADAGKKTKDDPTVQDVFDTFNEDQKKVVYYLIGAALEEPDDDDDDDDDDDNKKTAKHSSVNTNKKGAVNMKHNVFDQSMQSPDKATLSHEQRDSIFATAKRLGSLKDSFLEHAAEYGFDPIAILFPDAKDVEPGDPSVIKRDTVWVNRVLTDTNHTPFSRIRTRIADLTHDEARAKGYVTGNLKKEEVIPLMKRVTIPTTIYKKQKLDRDDLIDITDFDVVVWLKKEMRMMLDEEIARAVLIGDGRNIGDEDKINEQNVRPIILDDPNVFIHRVEVDFAMTIEDIIDEFIRARKFYKGSGVPTLYTSTDLLTEMLLLKDDFGHRLYKTVEELAAALRVNSIVEVEPMNDTVRIVGDEERKILGVVVNLKDYTIGADRGGQIAMFDDFDIDFNQHKYLIETRISGALTKPKSAIVLEMLPDDDVGL